MRKYKLQVTKSGTFPCKGDNFLVITSFLRSNRSRQKTNKPDITGNHAIKPIEPNTRANQ